MFRAHFNAILFPSETLVKTLSLMIQNLKPVLLLTAPSARNSQEKASPLPLAAKTGPAGPDETPYNGSLCGPWFDVRPGPLLLYLPGKWPR
jgi:hypothetical protein